MTIASSNPAAITTLNGPHYRYSGRTIPLQGRERNGGHLVNSGHRSGRNSRHHAPVPDVVDVRTGRMQPLDAGNNDSTGSQHSVHAWPPRQGHGR